jgi:capsid assembly protease
LKPNPGRSEGKPAMKYAHAITEFYQTPWAIKEETLTAMHSLLLQRSEGARWSTEEIRERIAEANASNGYVPLARDGGRFLAASDGAGGILMEGSNGRRNSAAPGSIALLPIVGIISHRMSGMTAMSGPGAGASIQKMTAQFRQALADDNCKAIVFDVDSPGGSVDGVPELASEILSARSYKPLIAVVNTMCCSAAYWLASAASDMVCTPSGQAGSIGVYMTHQDESEALKREGIKVTLIKAGKYKTEGNSAEPLPDEARAALQSKVDDYYQLFVKAVAQNRGTSQAAVRDGYGQGRSLMASDALKQDLVDRVGTLDDVLANLGVRVIGKHAAREALERRVAAMRNELALACMGRGVTTTAEENRRARQAWIRNEQLAAIRRGTTVSPTAAVSSKDNGQIRIDSLRRELKLLALS